MKHYKKIKKNSKNEAQLLLLAGIFISVSIVALSSVIVSLVDADVSIDETSYIKSDYDNVRKEFGMALKDKLGDSDYSESSIITHFNNTRDTFIFFIESLNGNYFNAEYLEPIYNDNNELTGIKCFIKLGNDKEFVSEILTYDIY